MVAGIISTLSGLKTCLGFVLHLIAIIALYAISLKGADTSNAIVGVVLSYAGSQAAKQISAHTSASKDPQCDTAQVIKDTDQQ